MDTRDVPPEHCHRSRVCRVMLMIGVFAVLGWCWEVALEFWEMGRYVNRGFLTGPYLPIYGFGAVALYYRWCALARPGFRSRVREMGALLLYSMAALTVFELATSYVMEWCFGGRWWDYTQYPWNLEGRVCLYSALALGLGGALCTGLIIPRLQALLDRMKPNTALWLAMALFCLVTWDFWYTALSLWIAGGIAGQGV